MQFSLLPHSAVTLHHGDMRDVAPHLSPASFQGIYIDPPYNTTNKGVKYKTELMAKKRWENFHADWDVWASQEAYQQDVEHWCEAMRPLLTPDGSLWICGSHHSIPTWDLTLKRMGFWVIQWLQWCIPNAMPNLAMRQMVSSNQTAIWARRSKKARHIYRKDVVKRLNGGKNFRDYWLIPNDCVTGRTYKHPSKKPVALIDRQIAISTEDGANVADFFAGSGTTGVAARNLDRPCVLVERDAKYVTMIEDRLGITKSEVTHERELPVHSPDAGSGTRHAA